MVFAAFTIAAAVDVVHIFVAPFALLLFDHVSKVLQLAYAN